MAKLIEQAVEQSNREAEFAKVRRAQSLISDIQRCREGIAELNEKIAECRDELKKIEHVAITAEQILGG